MRAFAAFPAARLWGKQDLRSSLKGNVGSNYVTNADRDGPCLSRKLPPLGGGVLRTPLVGATG
jgi:hypothetical protein